MLVAVPYRADAPDIMQECSVALWRRFDNYDEKPTFTGWALGFVRMEIRRILRCSSQRTQLTERAAELLLQDLQTHTDQLGAREYHLKHCIQRLKEERSVRDLSQFSNRSIEAIYKLIRRIRQGLQSCIELRLRRTTGREGLHEGKRLGSITTKEETDQLSRQLESDEGARLKHLHTADLLGILTTQEEFHEPAIDPLQVTVIDNLPAIEGIHGQIRRIEIPSSAEK